MRTVFGTALTCGVAKVGLLDVLLPELLGVFDEVRMALGV